MQTQLGLGAVFTVAMTCSVAMAETPICNDPDGWPASMAFTEMKNAGLLDNKDTDFSKTRAERIASEQIGDDLYRQVHLVLFTKKTGAVLQAVTVNNASSDECSMSPVDVYVVSQHLGGR